MSKLIFRYGSMDASKSAQLIMDWYGYNKHGKDTLVFKPLKDTRDDKITSRALNTKIPVDLLVADDDKDRMYKMVIENMPRMVFVDEVQFFTKEQIEELGRIVDVIGVSVQAYGLMTTFKGDLFEGSKRLVELSDVVERIRSECTRCTNEGVMNARFVDGVFQKDGETILIGAEESYVVLCRKCFQKEQRKCK